MDKHRRGGIHAALLDGSIRKGQRSNGKTGGNLCLFFFEKYRAKFKNGRKTAKKREWIRKRKVKNKSDLP